MSDGNEPETSLDEDMEADTQPFHVKCNHPNDSLGSKDQLLSRGVETLWHCKKKCTSASV